MIALLAAASVLAQSYDDLGYRLDGWTYLNSGQNRQLVQFVRPGPRRGLVWVRYEYRNVDATRHYMSARLLMELNCETQQTRTVQTSAFDDNNLTGRPVAVASSPIWEYAAPQTFSEAVLEYGCGL